MASAEQIRRAMEAEAPPDDVEYRAPPVVDVADDESEARGARRARTRTTRASRPSRAGRKSDCEPSWAPPSTSGSRSRTGTTSAGRSSTPELYCIKSRARHCCSRSASSLSARPGTTKKPYRGGAAGLFALYTFYKTQTGRQRKVVMDIDQFEWFFALQDAARGAPGHRGAHDVQVIFKMLFDDQGVDVALRRRAPQMPPIEEPWTGGLDLRDVAEASRTTTRCDRAVPALVADLKRLCARRNGAAPAAAIIEAPAPGARARGGAGAAPGPLRPFDGARRPRRGQRRGHGTAAAATTAAAADPRAAAQAPRAGRRGGASSPPCGRSSRRRRRRDNGLAARAVRRRGPAATVSADRPRQRTPAAAGHDEPAAASDDGTASAAVRADGPAATDVRAGTDGAASENGRPRQRAPAATGPARPVRRRRQRAGDPWDDDLRRVTYVLILVKLRHHDVGRRHGPPPDHVDTHTRSARRPPARR